MYGFGFGPEELTSLARNSIESSFLDESRKRDLNDELNGVLAANQGELA